MRLEIAEQHDRVGQIAEIDVRTDIADDAVLAEDQDGDDALLVQIAQHLVHLQQQVFLARHRLQEGVEAVDDDEA